MEALAVLLRQAPRGLLVIRDELAGWLQGFNQYKKSGGDEAHWLELHRAGTLLVDRKTGLLKTIYVPRAGVSVTGNIQPRILQAALGRTYFENGLAARLLFAMPPRRIKQWSETDLDPALEVRVARVLDRLLSLTFHTAEDGATEPVNVALTPRARAAWVAFYNAHAEEQAEILDHDLTAAWSKLEGYAARLALLVHCIRWAADGTTASPADVDEASIAAGVELSQWFGQEARRVYSVLAETSEERAQRQLLDLIQRKGGQITVRELMRANRQFKDVVQAEEQLQQLVQRGLVRMERVGTSRQGGRPYSRFVLAPVADSILTPPLPKNPAAADIAGNSTSRGRDTGRASEQATERSCQEAAPDAARIRDQVRLWPADRRREWEERAAIMEYEGNLSRTEAERLAWEEILREDPADRERAEGP